MEQEDQTVPRAEIRALASFLEHLRDHTAQEGDHHVETDAKLVQDAKAAGGTDGIGFETAVALVSWNASIVLPVRNLQKGELAKQKILTRLPEGSSGTIELVKCDLGSFSSVRKFTQEFISRGQEIHMLVLNAGMNAADIKLSEDGVEMIYQVNHLSHFLMTRLLLETNVYQQSPVRVVHVSSNFHYLGDVDELAYSVEKKNAEPTTSDILNAYSSTKQMNVLFSKKLQREYGSSRVTSIAIHPGFVISSLDRNLPAPLDKIVLGVRKLIARNTVDGAITQVTAATLPALGVAGGQYLEDRCIANLCRSCIHCNADGGGVIPKLVTLSVQKQDWLWDTSSAIVGLDSGIGNTVSNIQPH